MFTYKHYLTLVALIIAVVISYLQYRRDSNSTDTTVNEVNLLKSEVQRLSVLMDKLYKFQPKAQLNEVEPNPYKMKEKNE